MTLHFKDICLVVNKKPKRVFVDKCHTALASEHMEPVQFAYLKTTGKKIYAVKRSSLSDQLAENVLKLNKCQLK